MKATVLISDKGHPIFKRLVNWKDSIKDIHQISICNSVDEINDNAHILFLVSCTEIVTKKIRSFLIIPWYCMQAIFQKAEDGAHIYGRF